MKIVCDNCGAKYSIADEKVAGKVFKIRCKKCTGVIVVRGDQPSNESSEAAASDVTGGEGVWHVVVEGEQQGPHTPAKIGELLAAGTIDWEVYVWREGFESWQVARDVPELVDAVMGSTPSGQETGAGMMGADPFGSASNGASASEERAARSAGGGASAAQASAGGGGVFGASPFGAEAASPAATSGRGAVDLFAPTGGGASPFDAGSDDDDVVASMPSPRVSVEQSLTGQRNENSVLFSLANLQALATGTAAAPSVAPAPSAAPKPTAGAGMASGAGSGLIDIKALAGAASTTGGPSRRSEDRVDDLLSIGAGGGLGSALAGPVLAPVVEPEKSNKKLVVGAIAFAAVCLLAATVAIVMVATREPEQVATTAVGPTPTTTGTTQNALNPGTTTPSPTDPQPAVAGEEGPTETATARTGEPAGEGDESARGRSKRSRPRTGTGPAAGASGGTEEAAGTAAQGGTAAGGRRGSDDIDSLLEAALGSGGTKAGRTKAAAGAAEGGGGGDLPETPPRNAVASALQSVSGDVRSCGGGQHGTAMAAVTIQGTTGRVTNVQVTGQFQGTPVGSCVARAVRGARFPRFSRPTFQVSFPYRL